MDRAMIWSLVFIIVLLTTFSSLRIIITLGKGRDHLNFTQIVAQYGYISENHTVQTEDGYLLNVYRITHSAKCESGNTKSPVLLLNGLMASAECFLAAGVENALPYLIADACHDVWVGNARGSYDGRRHITLDPDNDHSFWDFSLEEIGKYDVPATIDYVLNHTGEQQLNFIGYSQGSGSFFVMCSERPEYCDKVKLLIGLAPSTKLSHTKSVLFRMCKIFIREFIAMYQFFGLREFMWKGILPIPVLCQYVPVLCFWFIAIMDSPHPGSIPTESLMLGVDHFPGGTSIKNFAHYSQFLTVHRYSKFDYGPEKNVVIYGGEPPEFNLSAVTTPTYLLHGANDAIVDFKDMEWLVGQLPNVKEFVIMEDPMWNHLDMIINKDLGCTLFPKVFKYLQLYNNKEQSIMNTIYSNDTLTFNTEEEEFLVIKK